jgi:farnesyl-diphosphate farnesyltransferase
VVAGIVGELMTALFILPPASVDPSMAAALSLRARSFGEGLQLVNILRDERADRSLGRRLIPPRGHARAVKLAWKDLVVAAEYTAILREGNAPAGVVAFAVFLTRLAKGTLDLVVRDGPGAKLSRAEVRAALAGLPVDHQSSRRDWR